MRKYLIVLMLLLSAGITVAQSSLTPVSEVDIYWATKYSGGRNIARTPAGNAVVLFEPGSGFTNGSQDIQYAVYNSIFNSWDVAKLSNSPNNTAGVPAIVSHPDSNICYAVWKEKNTNGLRDAMFAKLSFTDAYTHQWTSPVTADNIRNNVSVVTIDRADDGTLFNLFSIWQSPADMLGNIYAGMSSDDGQTWNTTNLTAVFPTPDELPFNYIDIALAPAPENGMYAVWEDKPTEVTNSYEVLMSEYKPAEGWSYPEIVTPVVEGDAFLQHYVDGYTPRSGAVSVYTMGPADYQYSSETSVLYYDNGTSKALTSAFNPYYMSPTETKNEWIADVVNFFALNPGDSILVVNDDNKYNNENVLTGALDAASAPYAVWDCGNTGGLADNIPTADILKRYALVIWFTGDDYNDLAFWNINDTLNTDLKSYMDVSGNKLWVFGRSFMADRYGSADSTFKAGDFVYDYLGIQSYDVQSWADDGNTGVAQLDLVSNNGLNVSDVDPISWGNAGIWQGKVSIASDPYRHLHMVYDQDKGKHVYYQNYDGISWSSPVQIDNTPDSISIVRPNITCDPNFGLYVVWTQPTGVDSSTGKTIQNVFYAVSPDAGTTWTEPIQLSRATEANSDGYSVKNPNMGEQVRKKIEGVFDGGADVVWTEYSSASSMGYYIMYANIPYAGTLTGIEDEHPAALYTFQLKPNYPNPFNPSTYINYELPITNYVELVIYNALGQKVRTLVNKRQEAGIHSVTFNAEGLPSGIYFAHLKAGGKTAVRKMILTK